jgi:hypothetical protein|tara:strand:- start:5454 stop:7232 length:1779 start_codon:yes stop_codon:yes gene_type:complete
MPNEIYHRSDWGESKAEDFGDVYYDHAATNKLYNHSDYYENSDGTDATLKDLNNKSSIVLTPTAYSDGSLNTVIPPYAPSEEADFNFSRGSSATRVNEQGLVQDVQILSGELVQNGNFDTDSDWTKGTGWTISGGKAIATNATGILSQSYSGLDSNKVYKVVYTVSNYTQGNVKFQFTNGTNVTGQKAEANGTYTEFLTPSATNNSFRLKAFSNFSGSIDNVSIIEITDDTDLPRIDFTDGTGSLLLEPQSTNLITYSNGFDDSSWGKTNVTVTENSETSPDGTNNAWLLQVTSDNDRHYLRVGGSTTSTVSISIFAKKGTTDYAYFFCGGTTNIQAIFDLSDGSVTDSGAIGSGSSFTSASSVSLGNGWYRLQISGTFSSPPDNRIGILPYYQSTFNGTPATSWQGNGENIYIYGAMEENNSYITSYIPTTSSTVTRSADVANNSGNADLFNDSEGVLYAEIAALANDGTFRSISISSDAGYNNSIMIRYISTSNQVNVITRIGSAINNTSVTVNNITEFNKIAFKYKSEDCVLFINGVQVATSAGAFNSSGINNLSFDRGGGGARFYGKTKCVAVFKEALTDAELQELTS